MSLSSQLPICWAPKSQASARAGNAWPCRSARTCCAPASWSCMSITAWGFWRALKRSPPVATEVDTLMLRYADDAKLKVQIDQIGKVWRYGSGSNPGSSSISLDRLHGDAWARRRARLEAEIRETASRMVELARRRNDSVAPKLVAPARDAERFTARFPFSLTPDQTAAIEAVLRSEE